MQEKIKRFLKVNKINEKQALVKFDKMAMKIAKQYSGKNEFEDLVEISSCKGLIISNSTFSWWAGWLASHLHKCTVIAPRPWRAKPTIADKNLLLESWVVVDREILT